MKRFGSALFLLAVIAGFASYFIACGGQGDDDSGDDTAPMDPLQVCIDESKRITGTDGCSSYTYPDQQIEDSCANAQSQAGSTECGTKAFEEMVTCLQNVDCSDKDMADQEWGECAGNFETDIGTCQ